MPRKNMADPSDKMTWADVEEYHGLICSYYGVEVHFTFAPAIAPWRSLSIRVWSRPADDADNFLLRREEVRTDLHDGFGASPSTFLKMLRELGAAIHDRPACWGQASKSGLDMMSSEGRQERKAFLETLLDVDL